MNSKNKQYNDTRLKKYHQEKVMVRSAAGRVAVTPAAVAIEERAILMEKKGMYRVASTLWLKCLDASQSEVERARIAFRRQRCISKSNGLRQGDYSGLTSGCAGGVIYE